MQIAWNGYIMQTGIVMVLFAIIKIVQETSKNVQETNKNE